MDKPQVISHIEKSMNFTLYDVKWIPCSAKFVVMGAHPQGTGALQVYEMNKGDVSLVHESQKSKAIKCGSFGASQLHQRCLATGDFEGKLNVWNLENTEVPVYSVQAHKEIINSIDGVAGLGIGEGAPEIVTGSRDGAVKVWDTRLKGKPVVEIAPAEGEARRDCWAVTFGHAYNHQDRCVAAGYDNGDLKLFDLRSMSLRWETNIKNGICGLEFDRKDINMNKLVVTTLESKFHVYDMRTQHSKKGFTSLEEKAHSSTVWSVRHLPQNRDIFMTTGGNGSICLWKYSYPASRVEKQEGEEEEVGVVGSVTQLQNTALTTQPISAFDWCVDKPGLAACTAFDQTLRILIVTKLNKV
ncbi:PREDICTED: WD repeat-containing protein 92-like [Priapulus caudatus]|uniref:WD repeat-containing protein 92-like n=1 Tax=Priapulus caudatus TaxID=37621 RepID=A0ABM1E4M0_PRICU|nr:PREDICTED: WD repeat-containing protein 92-like [Priapulus caudatus]